MSFFVSLQVEPRRNSKGRMSRIFLWEGEAACQNAARRKAFRAARSAGCDALRVLGVVAKG